MWHFPWDNVGDLVTLRITEELLKRGQGDLKVEIPIPINWIDELDIFSNFRLQQPFGLSSDGSGEYGRYYYVESLSYDFMNQRINIVGIDLQFLLRQCMIVAHCGDVNESWIAASEEERMYAYVGSCSAGAMPDGQPLKRVCPCS